MATIDDQASDMEERDRELCKKVRRPEPKRKENRCAYCEDITKHTFCSPECREDWEKIDRIKRGGYGRI